MVLTNDERWLAAERRAERALARNLKGSYNGSRKKQCEAGRRGVENEGKQQDGTGIRGGGGVAGVGVWGGGGVWGCGGV